MRRRSTRPRPGSISRRTPHRSNGRCAPWPRPPARGSMLDGERYKVLAARGSKGRNGAPGRSPAGRPTHHRLRFGRDPANRGPARGQAGDGDAADLLRGKPIVCRDAARKLTRFALTLEFDGGPFMGLQRQAHGPSVQQAVEEAVQAVTGETATLHSQPGAPMPGSMPWRCAPCRCREGDRTVPADGGAQRAPAARSGRGAGLRGGARRLARAVFLRGRGLSLPHRQSPRAADAGARAGVAGAAARSMPRRCTAPRRRWSGGTISPRSARSIARRKAGQDARPAGVRAGRRTGADRNAAARSFLHHQVRSMVGCLALVGMGRWPKSAWPKRWPRATGRRWASTRPPEGLYFVRALYPGE
jgi:tRNA pseudouridine38-40 synthase